MNNHTLKTLEWEKITAELSRHASSETGKLLCLNAEIYSDAEKIKLEQKRTSSAKYLLDRSIHPPLAGINNIKEAISNVKIGRILSSTELIDIGHNLETSRLLKYFFYKFSEETPLLYDISTGLFENRDLEESILDIFDDSGNILDFASNELRRLRLSLRDQTENLKNKLQSIMNSTEMAEMMQEHVYTMRGDRYVIPVKIEHKSHVPGIIHDMSSSGATIFVEPQGIVELNNKLREIELEIEAEVKRILAELSKNVAEYADELNWTLDILTEIDFIFARAKYSISIKAVEPDINSGKYLSLKNVRHPVLLKVLEKVVPNDIEIGKSFQVMVITGPNTGGKTVLLKTAGICVLMARAGMHVPADEADISPFFNVFTDIGDEQSITQSLSTFSAHIKNIIGILEKTDENSLILLDEIGAGTDPLEGTALAKAIMHNIKEKGARAMVTTHFSELKELAYTQEGFYNASVEFDTDTLSPTYRIIMGIPGKSNAIYIAQNLGLDKKIVENALENYLDKNDPTGKVLEGLQTTHQQLTRDAREIEEKKELIEELKVNYNQELEKIKAEKKKIIGNYRKKFDSAYFKAKEEISIILDTARKNRGEKVAKRSLSTLGEVISSARNMNNEEAELLEPQHDAVIWEQIKLGDNVFIKSLGKEGVLLAHPDKNGNVQIEIGILKTIVKKDEIFKAKNPAGKPVDSPRRSGFSLERTSVSQTLDLRGDTAEDALIKVEKHLDQANLANLSPVYIIHGHGTGKLRTEVRRYLATCGYAANFRPGGDGEGGDGVTVVELA